MKNLKSLFVLLFILTISNVKAQKFPVMSFEKNTYDFGTIHEKDIVKTVFKFKNTGNAPLIISKIRASCGCTIPGDYSKQPILPGAEGQFSVKFNSTHKPRKQRKRITITTNTKNGYEYVYITANVIPDPELEKIRQERTKALKARYASGNKKRKTKIIAKKKKVLKNKKDIKKVNKFKRKIERKNNKIKKLQEKISGYKREINKLYK